MQGGIDRERGNTSRSARGKFVVTVNTSDGPVLVRVAPHHGKGKKVRVTVIGGKSFKIEKAT